MLLMLQRSTAEWQPGEANAPALEYGFRSSGGDAEAFVDFLLTFRIYPGAELRVAISVDRQTPKLLEVPGSSGTENENGPVRSAAVQDSYRAVACALGELAASEHVLHDSGGGCLESRLTVCRCCRVRSRPEPSVYYGANELKSHRLLTGGRREPAVS
jgi:hypothetical protein